jgi:predicted DNA repair protein MutK
VKPGLRSRLHDLRQPERGCQHEHDARQRLFRNDLAWTPVSVLAVVGLGITAVVYCGVAVIVKADDIGVALAQSSGSSSINPLAKTVGRGLVLGRPVFLKVLGVIGA